MKKHILVTTDLSISSKAAIRFVTLLARQYQCSITFLHVVDLLVPTGWSITKSKAYTEAQIIEEKVRLKKFVERVLAKLEMPLAKVDFAIIPGRDVAKAIINFARLKKIEFICISTRGAGRLRRVLGTNTASIIKLSGIPTFAVPATYKVGDMNHVLYASDLTDVNYELKKVKSFAKTFEAKISVLHYNYFLHQKDAEEKFKKVSSRYKDSNTSFYLQNLDKDDTLSTHIKKAVRKFKPSIVCLFTKHNRNWYERLFLSSNSADLTYETKTPMIVFPKQ